MTPSDPPRDLPRDSSIQPARPLLLEAPSRLWYRRAWVWILIGVLIIAGVWFWRSRSQAPDSAQGQSQDATGSSKGGGRRGQQGGPGPNAVMPVGTATAKQADVPIYLNGLGSVTPVSTVTVKSRVDGQLVRINFTEGQLVKPGEVLAEIDARPFQVVVTQAEGTLARDQALLANARVDLDRYRKLVEQDSIATQQLDTQKALVNQYEGTLKGDRGNLDSAKLQLSYTKVIAPVGGRLGLKQVDVGNMIHTSDTNGIVVITQLQPIDVVFSVPEANVQRVMKRLVAGSTLPVDAFNRESTTVLASGSLITVDNQIDVGTGTVKLKARFVNAAYDLFPNQFVNARLLLDVQRGATVIPPAAVQRGAQGLYVYVVGGDNTVTSRIVKTGVSQGDAVAIDDGIKVGEVVVVDGTDKLKEGAKVEPVARDGAVVPASGKAGVAPANSRGSDANMTPEERQNRWVEINKRIDAGEFGEEIKKLPEAERKQKMAEMRRQRQGAGGNPGPPQ